MESGQSKDKQYATSYSSGNFPVASFTKVTTIPASLTGAKFTPEAKTFLLDFGEVDAEFSHLLAGPYKSVENMKIECAEMKYCFIRNSAEITIFELQA